MTERHLLVSDEIQILVKEKQNELARKLKVRINMENITNIAIKEGIDKVDDVIKSKLGLSPEDRISTDESNKKEIEINTTDLESVVRKLFQEDTDSQEEYTGK